MSLSELHEACDLSVIVPFYNEQDSVVPLWEEIRDAVEPMGVSFEAIFVDDGSTDEGPARLLRLCGREPRLKVARFSGNCGQTAALAAGFELASGRIIVPLDADRQNDPASIPDLVNELKKGYDVVSGWRKQRQDGALLRRLPSKLANMLISRVTGVRLHDYGCTMKAYKAEYIRDVRLYGQMHRFIPVYCAAQGARIGEIVVRHRPRTAGRTKYGIDRTFRVLLDLLTVQMLHKYRGRPMHLFGRFAFAFVGLGALVMLAGIAASVIYRDLPLLLILLGIGMGICCMGALAALAGLIAELLMRVYYESQSQRPYQIDSLINFEPQSGAASESAVVGDSMQQRRPH
ncbi:MAG: glycosyltransferase family 2 protein [Phycisphaerales bacterium]|nr:MAG: glycosyltransferase family 2 protein [Phycisphaerales bacterium]